ncbi:Vegetative incompatibility protein HET-E-1 [Madurella mycetomatis]|uniref:Vegetative incompatibility protein HET-E-1 n=1 Tax=Madurella mycetomatis TaxID=100816 RepID=A0A175W2M5_9PEZI|nr:Vegetative incompatibility protein HET-E-1 [Madurella mycetomatis]
MRLLNVDTFRLEEFFCADPPPYAILTHTWGNDSEEVSYRDVLNGMLDLPGARPFKVAGCCKRAKEDGYRYVWIDTCCIDKTNSVELQEAINSMFRWYRDAAICYAFLSDVPSGDRHQDPRSAFSASRWFQRGWTLQELLAPLNFRFYDAAWRCIGTKGDLCDTIEEITGIPASFLLGIADLHQASVAQRMSWAAGRVTKRQEDVAYCLIGIFGVSMPMIYGEGVKAFDRLQEQIMKDIGDVSILAWGLDVLGLASSKSSPARLGTALAPDPSHFANSRRVVLLDNPTHASFGLDGRTIRLSLPLHTTPDGHVLGLLNCSLEQEQGKAIGIPLAAAPGGQPHRYARLESRPAVLIGSHGSGVASTTIEIQLDGSRNSPLTAAEQACWFHIRKSVPGLELIDVNPPACWHRERALIQTETARPDPEGAQRILARFRDNTKDSLDFVVVLEVESPALPSCNVMVASRLTSLAEIKARSEVWRRKVSGQQCASNGIFNLRMELETRQATSYAKCQQAFVVKPVALANVAETTINATAELRTAGITNILGHLSETMCGNRLERRSLEDQITKLDHKSARIQEEQEKVRAKIEALKEREGRLAKEKEHVSRARDPLVAKHDRMKKEEERLSDLLSATRRLLGAYKCESTTEQDGDTSKTEEQMLPFAIGKGYHSLVRLLLARGVGVMGRDLDRRTPLHAASWAGKEELVRVLLKRGADVAAQDSHGWTALHLAAAGGFGAVSRLLLETGADTEARTHGGMTPLRLAESQGHTHIIELLLHRDDSPCQTPSDSTGMEQVGRDGRQRTPRPKVQALLRLNKGVLYNMLTRD